MWGTISSSRNESIELELGCGFLTCERSWGFSRGLRIGRAGGCYGRRWGVVRRLIVPTVMHASCVAILFSTCHVLRSRAFGQDRSDAGIRGQL